MPFKILPKGTRLYHGTRYQAGQPRWWGNNKYPNNEGEDGGVSFTLGRYASSKVTQANVILEYYLIKNVSAIHCRNKSEFYAVLRSTPDAVCYTDIEQEVVIGLNYLSTYLQYERDNQQSCGIL